MNIKKPLIPFLIFFSAFITDADERSQPNIIHVILDDMGYSDLGSFGGEIDTPEIDKLAETGIRFTQFYNAAKCETTRASLLSGLWWTEARVGLKKGITMGEALQAAGYQTGAFGKWHIDGNPVDRGFDYFFGILNGVCDFFKGNEHFRLNRDIYTDFYDGFYTTDAFTDHTLKFIREAVEDENPFFAYLSYTAPHNPLQVPEEDIMKNRGEYMKGWNQIRHSRYRKMIELGIIPLGTALPQYPENLPDWEDLTPAQKDLEDLRMAVYASMIESVDENMGRVISELKSLGVLDNTLIFFHSDNGTNPFIHRDNVNLDRGKLPGEPNSNWELGNGWSFASVTPLRLYKRNQHEGGICSPLIAWFGSNIKNPGSIDHTPIHIVDVMPTLLELAGITYEEASQGKNVPALSGTSITPLLKGGNFDKERPLYFQFMDHRALRKGPWKIAAVDDGPWELYNIETDRTERNDLIHSKPEKANQLIAMWDEWWESTSGGVYKNRHPAFHQRKGDRGTGYPFNPTAMRPELKDRYPLPEEYQY